jgi:glucose-6-phosphate dehydrogenase assembly protein OpcA
VAAIVSTEAGAAQDKDGVAEDVWSARDTTPDAIEAALRELLRRRHAANRALAPARVLNLIVIVDRDSKDEISSRLERVGRYHASRTILCAVEEGRGTLDAVAKIAYDESAEGRVHPIHETVEIDVGSDQLSRLDTIVDPVLVSELTTLLWSPHGYDVAIEALLPMIDVILLDSDDHQFSAGLDRASELLRSAYVVDLAWLRTTPWRERLAASFDPPERLAALWQLDQVCVRHRPTSAASAALLAGWLASRLGWNAAPLQAVNGAGWRGKVPRGKGDDQVEIALAPFDQESPGLAGVTVSWNADSSLSLDRTRGGLSAHQRSSSGEREWRVLGASRGEGGILGEGVRQALLRDPTYGPALDAARALCCEPGT